MCKVMEDIRQKGVIKGRIQKQTENICNLIEMLGLDLEQAMAALKAPKGERQKYKDLIEQETSKE